MIVIPDDLPESFRTFVGYLRGDMEKLNYLAGYELGRCTNYSGPFLADLSDALTADILNGTINSVEDIRAALPKAGEQL